MKMQMKIGIDIETIGPYAG